MFEILPLTSSKFENQFDQLTDYEKTYYPSHFFAVERRAKLENFENDISRCVDSVNKSFVSIGWLLSCIEENCLFNVVADEHGSYCRNIYQYAALRFGLRKTTVYNLISVARTFSDNGVLLPEFEAFSFSQLSELLSVPESARSQFSPDMTVKDIRSAKRLLPSDTSSVVPTSEQSSDVSNVSRTQSLSSLLEIADTYYLWFNGKKDFERMASFLISQGVIFKT